MAKTSLSKLAQVKVKYAVDKGHIEKPNRCEKCGKPHGRLHGHHKDYSNSLQVTWLCPGCHMSEHSKKSVIATKLAVYLRKTYPNLTPAERYREFSGLIGVHPFYVYQLGTGVRQASLKMAEKIARTTGGLVQLADLRPDLAATVSRIQEFEAQAQTG